MARTWVCGFETGQLTAEANANASANSSVVGSAAIESTIVRSGQYSLKATPASGAAGYWLRGSASGAGIYVRFYVRFTVLPATTRAFFGNSTAANNLNCRITPAGAVEFRSGSTLKATSATLLTDTTRWYKIEVKWVASSQLCYVDDELVFTGSVAGDNLVDYRLGSDDTVAATYTAYYDDVATDNAALPGPGRVVMLLPTSVNAAGGWVEGDGAGTAGMAAAVATRPPPGVASASETSATNIESPTGTADNCDMNMTTYTAAGIGPSDTVNGIFAVIRHGEDIATGTKTGKMQIVSNPTQAVADAFSNGASAAYGSDGGAHGAEPGLWHTGQGSVQTGAITLGTAPVLRVIKDTGTTRVVCVDFMGMYVEYTEHRAPPWGRFHRNYIVR